VGTVDTCSWSQSAAHSLPVGVTRQGVERLTCEFEAIARQIQQIHAAVRLECRCSVRLVTQELLIVEECRVDVRTRSKRRWQAARVVDNTAVPDSESEACLAHAQTVVGVFEAVAREALVERSNLGVGPPGQVHAHKCQRFGLEAKTGPLARDLARIADDPGDSGGAHSELRDRANVVCQLTEAVARRQARVVVQQDYVLGRGTDTDIGIPGEDEWFYP
jgi:hypothetical protein